jgi:hypothetical protein
MQSIWQNRPAQNLNRNSRSDSRNNVFGQTRFVRLVPLALACLMAVPPVFGQTDTARIQGSVTDPSGAAIPGATIAVRNTDTNATVTVLKTTVASGVFGPLVGALAEAILSRDWCAATARHWPITATTVGPILLPCTS